MRSLLVLMVTVVSLGWTIVSSAEMEESTLASSSQIEGSAEYDSESARKIIGSRVVTSVSVVMNGKEPQFADAVGNYIPRPLVPPRVASPVSLLDPDRYEFYTFNDDGELVKRLMTMDEIQSIVANGDSEQQAALAKSPTGTVDNEANIRDIVNNVQKVLHSEMVHNNFTASLTHNKLDTPDTSSSWSSILPAIFGNTGESILANRVPVTTGSTADSIIMHTTHKKPPPKHKTPSTSSIFKTTLPPKTTISKLTKQKPKPSRPASSSTITTLRPSSATQNVKYSSIAQTTQIVRNTAAPITKTQYSQQNSTFTSKPTKAITVGKPSGTTSKPYTAQVHKISNQKITQTPDRIISATATTSTKKPLSKRPTTLNKFSTTALKTSPASISSSTNTTRIPVSISTSVTSTTRLPSTVELASTKKNKISSVPTISPSHYTFATTVSTQKKSGTTTPKPKTTKITGDTYELKENVVTETSKYVTTSAQSHTTRKTATSPIPTIAHVSPQTMNPNDSAAYEPEPDDVFDSELSLNQIIESLKDLEGTTIPFASNYVDFMDMTTFEPDSMPFNKFNTESVTIMNNGQSTNAQLNLEKVAGGFKQSIVDNVSYIPQTTIEYSPPLSTTDSYAQMKNHTKTGGSGITNSHYFNTILFGGIEHKESDDEMVLDEKTTTDSVIITTTDSSLSKQSTNSMDTLLRESFDSVLSQVQSNGLSTTIDYNDIGTTPFPQSQDSTTIKPNEKKKVVLNPTPFVPAEELEGGATEPMKYFEAVIKHYEQEKSKNQSADISTQKLIDDASMKTTEEPVAFETTTDTKMTTTEDISLGFSEKLLAQTTTESHAMESETQSTTFSIDESPTNFLRTESSMYLASDEATKTITTEPNEISTIMWDSTEEQTKSTTERTENVFTIRTSEGYTTEAGIPDTTTDIDNLDQTTISSDIQSGSLDENQTQYEMIHLIENIVKNITIDKTNSQNGTNSVERKEDSTDLVNKTSEIKAQSETTKRADIEFSDLGEATTPFPIIESKIQNDSMTVFKANNTASIKSQVNKLKVPTLAPILNNLKMKVVNALKNTNTIHLEPAPKQALGLEESTVNASDDVLEFAKFCNQLAFDFWIALNNEGISSARSLTLSPFALTSMLGALFLGARGRTSGEINDMLHLDDIVSFNPHAMLRNISESVDEDKDANVYSNVFVRELLSDRSKGKILPFFKEKVNQFYSGYVEEVNFNTVNDIIRRRTNLLMKRYTGGKSSEYLKTSNVWVKPPLAGISANLFETDCSKASKNERDGEMFFQVLPAIRQRRLIPIPAVVWKSGFTAGYDPELDATAVAIGLSKNIVSTIFVMPGQQGHSAPGDNLERLESVLMTNAVSKNAWRRLLATLMERPGLEVQIPRFTHRSFVNTTNALRKLGLDTLFDQNLADLRGITGSIGRDVYVSDLIQINTFSTCGEDKLAEQHHVEMYPAPPNKHRTIEYKTSTSTLQPVPVAADYENERAFASDPIYDLRYLSLPLPLRPRQARIPEVPRLRFDKPFVYFVRHNPTGMVLYFGRFNPRLLP